MNITIPDKQSRVTIVDNEDGCLMIDFCGEDLKVVFHLNVKPNRWTKSKYREWKEFFSGILSTLKEKGYTIVFSAVERDDVKAIKFNMMFGFTPVKEWKNLLYMKRAL